MWCGFPRRCRASHTPLGATTMSAAATVAETTTPPPGSPAPAERPASAMVSGAGILARRTHGHVTRRPARVAPSPRRRASQASLGGSGRVGGAAAAPRPPKSPHGANFLAAGAPRRRRSTPNARLLALGRPQPPLCARQLSGGASPAHHQLPPFHRVSQTAASSPGSVASSADVAPAGHESPRSVLEIKGECRGGADSGRGSRRAAPLGAAGAAAAGRRPRRRVRVAPWFGWRRRGGRGGRTPPSRPHVRARRSTSDAAVRPPHPNPATPPDTPAAGSQQPLRLILHNDSTGCTATAPGRRLERSDLARPRPNTAAEEAVAIATQFLFFT